MKMSKFKLAKTDVNRFKYERNDCFVRALSLAEGIPYNQAHDLCKYVGRRDKHKMHGILKLMKILNYRIDRHYITLKAFYNQKQHNRGIIVRSGHAFAINNGYQYDMEENSSRVLVKYYIYKENKS